jgi:hypothetical protein
MLRGAAGGFGALALHGILAGRQAPPAHAAVAAASDPLAPKTSHFPARAKCVIFLYMTGGVSHVDSFDPKPKLFADHGKTITVDNWQGKLGEFKRYLKQPQWKFQPYGQSGIEVSELFPHIGQCIDDICVVRSMESDHTNHYEATLGMPSIGSWVSYGLGSENQNLPAFVAIAPHAPYAGAQTWGSDFLPGCHQATQVFPGDVPIANIQRRVPTLELQQMELDLRSKLNHEYRERRAGDLALDARIKSFETAFGMQREAPAVFDLAQETDDTLGLYGLARGQTTGFGWQCLVARRLAERGVRFIELIDTGSSGNWDSHGNMNDHVALAKNVDQPISGLIRDLKRRGMLDETLVVWTTEFGRTPYHAEPNALGREHHHQAFSSWLAGGGVKGGFAHGSTDEYGIAIADRKVHVHDFHATILHLLGIDHQRLTYRSSGRDYRLTDVSGAVVRDVIA